MTDYTTVNDIFLRSPIALPKECLTLLPVHVLAITHDPVSLGLCLLKPIGGDLFQERYSLSFPFSLIHNFAG